MSGADRLTLVDHRRRRSQGVIDGTHSPVVGVSKNGTNPKHTPAGSSTLAVNRPLAPTVPHGSSGPFVNTMPQARRSAPEADRDATSGELGLLVGARVDLPGRPRHDERCTREATHRRPLPGTTPLSATAA
jgi:hypothetical protein